MKKLRVIVSIICFFFCITTFLHAVDFKVQTDLDNTNNWLSITPSDPGVFYDNFFLSEPVIIQPNITLRSNDSSIRRTLTTNNSNSFFSFLEGSSNTCLTIDGLILKGGKYKEGYIKGGAAICVYGTNFTLNGDVSFIQNTASEGAGGAVFLSTGTLTFNGNIEFKENLVLSGAGGAVNCSSGNIIFNKYVTAESNESSLGGVLRAEGVVLNDGGYFVNNKARKGGAICLSGGTSTIKAITKDVLFSGNIMQSEITTVNARNDIYIEGINNLTFAAASSRTITLDGGILCDDSNSIVNKTGAGTLIFNGDFNLKTFNVYEGVLNFGGGLTFYAADVYFSTGVFINMRNESSNELGFGNLTSSATIYYDVNLENKSLDKIVVGNTAHMDGTRIKVAISGVSGDSVTYNIILATGGAGGIGTIGFDHTNDQGSFMTRIHDKLDYGGGSTTSWHEVNLTLQVDQLSDINNLSENGHSTAFVLDSDYGAAESDYFFMIDAIDKMGDAVASKKSALNDLSGDIYANVITVAALNTSRNNILSRLERSYFSNDDTLNKRNIWAHWYNASNLYKGSVNFPGDFKVTQKGFQAGFDTLKADICTFGITVGFVESNCTQNDDQIDINGYNVGCYGSCFFDNNLETRILLIGCRENYKSTRNIEYLNRKTGTEFAGYSVNTLAEIAYNYYYNYKLCVKPFIGFSYGYAHIDDFIEKGANAADLHILDNSYNRSETLFGFRINNGIESRFKWQAELKSDLFIYGRSGNVKAKFRNGAQSMNIKGIKSDFINFVFGLNIFYDITKYLNIYANIDAFIPDVQEIFYCNVGTNFKFNIDIKDFYEKSILTKNNL
jgi:predicted outer membrane repeat protein